jgi:hypothetical protein
MTRGRTAEEMGGRKDKKEKDAGLAGNIPT